MNTVNVNNVDEFLEEFDIIKDSDNCYLIPEYCATFDDGYYDNRPFTILDFNDLVVEDGDLLVVMLWEDNTLQVWDIDTNTTGYISAYYSSDDGRHDLMHTIANYFKDKKVSVMNYLIYDKEETVDYIDLLLNI